MRESKSGFSWILRATYPQPNKDTELAFLIECKYHDLSRNWIFLPHESAGRWCFNDRVFNCGPYQTLVSPQSDSLLQLAPTVSNGIVVSEDGQKQPNAVRRAVEQLANGYVPAALADMYQYNIDYRNGGTPADQLRFTPEATALVPMVVTNATIYRMKPTVSDLNAIREVIANGYRRRTGLGLVLSGHVEGIVRPERGGD